MYVRIDCWFGAVTFVSRIPSLVSLARPLYQLLLVSAHPRECQKIRPHRRNSRACFDRYRRAAGMRTTKQIRIELCGIGAATDNSDARSSLSQYLVLYL